VGSFDCVADKARLSGKCHICPNRKDVGNEWICCSDCSEPAITDVKSKTGYCQTDAYLSFQPKPRGESNYIVESHLLLWISLSSCVSVMTLFPV
jgi:hypothetical protein